MPNDMVTVPLAHKFPKAEALRLGAAEVRDYQPGEDITVPRGSAEMLAVSAQLQVNPRDLGAIRELLARGTVPAQAPAAKPAAPAGGNTAAQGS